MIRFSFSESLLNEARDDLLAAAPLEAAGAFLCGYHVDGCAHKLLPRQFVRFSADELLEQESDVVIVRPSAVASILRDARKTGLSIALAHTHPFGNAAHFSSADEAGEKRLMPTVFQRLPNRPHGTVLFAADGIAAKAFPTPYNGSLSDDIISVGDTLRIIRRHELEFTEDLERYDRSVRLFGSEGQMALKTLKIGIVGLGGTGSAIAQQLAYLGVQDFILVDGDTVDQSNLNRLIGATPASAGQPKVNVAGQMIRAIVPSAKIDLVQQSVLFNSAARKILSCDVLFACTDNHGSRSLLNQIAYQYYIPTFDMGVVIDARNGVISGMSGRVQLLAPGRPCLVCQNFLDPEEVRRDYLSDEERRADPYISGGVPQPAVVSLNTTMASLAVTMFLAVAAHIPMNSRHQVYRIASGQVASIAVATNPDCIISSLHGALGRGDSWPLPVRQDEG